MEQPWWPWIWLAGAALGYALFMRYQPLGPTFAEAFRFARNNLTLVAGLAVLFAGDVVWRSWRESGLGSGNTLALSVGTWNDLLAWIPYASEDLRLIFWYCVPLDAAFALGTPVVMLTCWYWMPRLWKAFEGRGRWLAAGIFIFYVLAFWWWVSRCGQLLGHEMGGLPQNGIWGELLRVNGEIVFAVVLVCFVQLVLLLGAYRSYGPGDCRCRLKEALDWGLKWFPRMLPVPCLVLLGWGINLLAVEYLDRGAASAWSVLKLVVLLGTAPVPICVLFLQDLRFVEALRAAYRFIGRTAWRFAWFIFLCFTHFFLLRLVESYFLASVLTHEAAVVACYLVVALVKAALVMWFVNAFCLYFCLDITQRQKPRRRGAKKGSALGLRLATLQARLRPGGGVRSRAKKRYLPYS